MDECNTRSNKSIGTRLVHNARNPRAQHGFVNTPIHRGSTVLFPTLDALEAAVRVDTRTGSYVYGLMANPNSRELEAMLAQLDAAWAPSSSRVDSPRFQFRCWRCSAQATICS